MKIAFILILLLLLWSSCHNETPVRPKPKMAEQQPGKPLRAMDTTVTLTCNYTAFDLSSPESQARLLRAANKYYFALPFDYLQIKGYTASDNISVFASDSILTIQAISTGKGHVKCWDFRNDTIYRLKVNITKPERWDSLEKMLATEDRFIIFNDQDAEARWKGFLVNKQLPNISLSTVAGNRVNNASFLNKVSIINFWSPGCGPCRLEIPLIAEVMEEFGDGSAVQCYGFAPDSGYIKDGNQFYREQMFDPATRTTYFKYLKFNLPYPSATNTSGLEPAFHVNSIPRLFITDKKGIVRYVYSGYSERNFKESLRAHIRFLGKMEY